MCGGAAACVRQPHRDRELAQDWNYGCLWSDLNGGRSCVAGVLEKCI